MKKGKFAGRGESEPGMTPAYIHPMNGGLYGVDLGSGRVSDHIVDNRFKCSCGSDCGAAREVQTYLKKGGANAPAGSEGFYATAPRNCPICDAAAGQKTENDSRVHGAGWTCSAGGDAHYWEYRSRLVRAAQSQKRPHGLVRF